LQQSRNTAKGVNAFALQRIRPKSKIFHDSLLCGPDKYLCDDQNYQIDPDADAIILFALSNFAYDLCRKFDDFWRKLRYDWGHGKTLLPNRIPCHCNGLKADVSIHGFAGHRQ
jgi:hypothetical protein